MTDIERISTKYGGTSNSTAETVQDSFDQSRNSLVVVTSAPGVLSDKQLQDFGVYSHIPEDILASKVTDQLLNAHRSYQANGEIDNIYSESIQARFAMIVDGLGLTALQGDWTSHIPDRVRAAAMSNEDDASMLGELLSTDIWAAMGRTPLNPADSGLNLSKSAYNWRRWLRHIDPADGVRYILPGNIYYDGRRLRTFGRGGSDISNSFAGYGIRADYVVNNSDTILQSISPKYVPDPAKRRDVTDLTYREARELGLNGTGIVHPDALTILMGTGIDTVLGNTFDPDGPKTVYSDEPAESRGRGMPRAMSVMDDVVIISVHEPGMSGDHGRVGTLSRALARRGVNAIDVQSGGADTEKFIVAADTETAQDASVATEVFEKQRSRKGDVSARHAMLVTIVGHHVSKNVRNVSDKLYRAGFLNQENDWIQPEHSIRFTYPTEYPVATAAKIHAAIFE